MRTLAARMCVLALTAGVAVTALSCTREQKTAAPAAAPAQPDIAFPGIQLRPGADRTAYTLVGRVRNRSDRTVGEVTVNVWMEDVLYSGASTSAASTVVVLRLDVPPGESRHFEEKVVFRDLPKPAGRHEWNYAVADVKRN